MEYVTETVKRTGYLLYIMNPNDHNYKEIDDVKDYYKEVAPLFLVTVLLEQVVRFYQNKPLWKLNDTVSNGSHGILMELSKIPFRGIEVWIYAWLYNNYRLVTLPWDSPWTWITCWLVTDFCYYWMHRMIHQINILWAIHETHHTPEEMMFTAPMRNHIFLLPIHWLTYLPMAFAIPPTTYLVHYQISILYQYWLHSEIVDKLPAVVEFLFSTPSHHRVHHGRNRRYIDKNFGGFLIIWDRIFGTYEDELENDKPIYGTTKPIRSFNPLVIQTSHFVTIWKRFWEIEGFKNKLSVIFKGPGWSPGKPWVGDLQDIPEPPPYIEKFSPVLPIWLKYYVLTHFVVFLNGYYCLALNISMISKSTINVVATFLTYTTFSFGFLLDLSPYALPVEFARCVLYFLTDKLIYHEVSKFSYAIVIVMIVNRVVFFGSIIIWMVKIMHDVLRGVLKEKIV